MDQETPVPATEETPSAPAVEQTTEQPEQAPPEQKEEPKPEEPKTPRWFRQTIARKDQQIGELRAQLRMVAEQAPRQQEPEDGQVRIDPSEIQQRVMTAAEQIAQQRQFDAKSNAVFEQGTKEFKDFEASLGNLRMAGGVDPQTLALIVEGDAPARVLYHLGQNLDEAADLLSLPLPQRARALAKLEVKLEAESKPKPSNAPKPLSPVKATPAADGLRDDIPMDEWLKRRQAQLRAR